MSERGWHWVVHAVAPSCGAWLPGSPNCTPCCTPQFVCPPSCARSATRQQLGERLRPSAGRGWSICGDLGLAGLPPRHGAEDSLGCSWVVGKRAETWLCQHKAFLGLQSRNSLEAQGCEHVSSVCPFTLVRGKQRTGLWLLTMYRLCCEGRA